MNYHKLSALISDDIGRAWKVSVEPPINAPPEGEQVEWEVTLKNLEGKGSVIDTTIKAPDLFAALAGAVGLVPPRAR